MLRAIANGEPEKLANFARRTMNQKKDDLELALQGYVNTSSSCQATSSCRLVATLLGAQTVVSLITPPSLLRGKEVVVDARLDFLLV